MPLSLTAEQRATLQVAQARSRQVRHLRRFQAVLLRADGVPVVTVARSLKCTETSVYNRVAAWRADGIAGVAEGAHPGKARLLDAVAEAVLKELLAEGDPQVHGYAATGWTVPLLRIELAKRGWQAAAQILRTLHRLGWRLKRPKFVLGRPDPAYTEKKEPSLSKWQPW